MRFLLSKSRSNPCCVYEYIMLKNTKKFNVRTTSSIKRRKLDNTMVCVLRVPEVRNTYVSRSSAHQAAEMIGTCCRGSLMPPWVAMDPFSRWLLKVKRGMKVVRVRTRNTEIVKLIRSFLFFFFPFSLSFLYFRVSFFCSTSTLN